MLPPEVSSSRVQYIRPRSCRREVEYSADSSHRRCFSMSKAPKSRNKPGGSAAKSRPSSSGPAKPRPDLSDALESKADATQGLALARPFNEIKAAEFDPAAHVDPPQGP